MRTIITALAMVLTASAANAQTTQNKPSPPASHEDIARMGLSGVVPFRKCSQYIADTAGNKNVEAIYLTWAEGFTSGANFPVIGKDVVAWDGYKKTAHLQEYCGKNKDDYFVFAVINLLRALPEIAKGK